MGCERHQPLHVFQACVQVTSCDHRAIQRLQQICGHADQFVFNRSGLLRACHDFAAGETGAIKVVLVGH